MLVPSNIVACWLVLAVVAAVAIWRRPHWVGVWVGWALLVGGWAYALVAPAAAPPDYYPLMEFLTGFAAVVVGACVSLLGAVYAHRQGRPGARVGGALAVGLAGLGVGYFGPRLTGGINSQTDRAADREEAQVKVLDVTVHREVGRPVEASVQARRYMDRVVLPVGAAAGALAGLGLGWMAFRQPRRAVARFAAPGRGAYT